MSARDLTGAGLIRVLRGLAAGQAVARAVESRAEALATAIAARRPGAAVSVMPRGAGEVVVTAAAEGLFAREFGSRAAPPDPVVGAAIADLARRGP